MNRIGFAFRNACGNFLAWYLWRNPDKESKCKN